MGEGNPTSSSIKKSRNHTQIETAAILQHIQFLKQQNTTLESELHVMRRSLTDMIGKLHKAAQYRKWQALHFFIQEKERDMGR